MKIKLFLVRLLLGLLTALLGGVGGGFCLPPSAFAATNIVRIGSYFFNPTNITINLGDTITWSNALALAHDTTQATNLWAGPLLSNGMTFSFTFTNAGFYPYFCKTHVAMHPQQTGTVSVVTAANNPPTVLITNPVNNARFCAPASIPLQATASDTDGSVTNVQFFSNEVFCGSAPIAPFNFTLGNVAAGNYSLTARAADNQGALGTSAVVNVSVLTNAMLTTPVQLPGGQFQLTILGVAGQTYATEASTNLQNWSAFITNVAPANTFNITDSTAPGVLFRFYRARQDL